MNAVISAIRVALRKEHYLSQSVLRMVGSFDAQQYLNEMEERYRARAKVLFDKSVEIQKDNIPFFLRYEDGDIKEEAYMAYREMMLQDLEEVSDKFTALNKEVMKKRKLFATDNPWIKRYKDLEVKGELTEDLIKKYVMSIHVSKDGELTVYLNISGREVFPKSWIERKGGIYAT